MKVSTTSTSAATLAVPYTCRCAYCGTAIHGKEKITAEGHAFTGGYATGAQGERMKLAASMRANASMPYEIEYAEKRLDHYRDTVSSGRLKAYLESGKKHKEDYFRVDPNSPLGNYLLHGPNKTVAQADHDKIRMTQYPYNWKAFDKNTAVKCPACGKVQPWCEDLSGESAGWKAFFLGAGVCILGLAPFMAGLKLVQEQVLLVLLPLVSGIVAGILIYKALRKKQLQRQAALPWNADDLPRFDEDFLAAQKARWQPASNAPLLVYLDIDRLSGGIYGLAAGQAVARALSADEMEGIAISSGDSAATLAGSANEYVIGLSGEASHLDRIEARLRSDAALGELLSRPGIRRSNANEPLVADGMVREGELINPPGHGTSFCAAGFKDIWKKQK